MHEKEAESMEWDMDKESKLRGKLNGRSTPIEVEQIIGSQKIEIKIPMNGAKTAIACPTLHLLRIAIKHMQSFHVSVMCKSLLSAHQVQVRPTHH